jgi:hypothetical protein
MPHLSLVDLGSRTMAEGKKSKWISKAVKPSHKGIFKEKAERAGMSTAAYAEKEKGASGTLGKEARLAQTFSGMRKRRKSPLHDHPRSSRD